MLLNELTALFSTQLNIDIVQLTSIIETNNIKLKSFRIKIHKCIPKRLVLLMINKFPTNSMKVLFHRI